MRNISIYVISCLIAGASPLFKTTQEYNTSGFTGWQKTFQGKELKKLPLSEIEENFSKDFPGKVGRFTDSKRQIIFRWVKEETRKLHPASDCFKGLGYSIKPMPVFIDKEKKSWGRFEAIKDNEKIMVSERIFDEHGNSWTDVSSWYWSAFLNRTAQSIPFIKNTTTNNTVEPWWTITIAEKI